MNWRDRSPMNGSANLLFRVTGLLACVVADLEGFVHLLFAGPERVTRPLVGLLGVGADQVRTLFVAVLALRLVGLLAFAAVFWVSTRPRGHSLRNGAALLVVQFVLALAIEPELLYIVAAELPFVLPMRAALAWLGLQSAGIAAITALAMGELQFSLTATLGPEVVPMAPIPVPLGVAFGAAVVAAIAWQAFAFCMGYIAAAERRGRIKLAGANAELVAMQQLLGDSARAAERLRIARDLHDGLGHHLTALSLHLDLAARQTDVKAAGSIHTSHDIARQLLVEVRTAIGVERMEQAIDLRQALQTLCSGMPMPCIALSFDDRLRVTDAALAHVVFRSVQEAISNAARHAAAQCVEVALAATDGGLSVVVADNGRGVGQFQPGNGLRGMRERIEERGGTLETVSGAAGGFTVRIWLPQRGDRR